MNWKNLKFLLLALLLAANLLLLQLTADYYIEAGFTSDSTAKTAAKILAESGINVSSDMLSIENEGADILIASYSKENYAAATAAFLFGKEAESVFLLPDGILAESAEGESLFAGFDMSVKYISPKLYAELDKALNDATQVEGSEAVASLERLLTLEKGSIDSYVCKEYKGVSFITFTQSEGGLPIYGMECTFGIKDEKIIYAVGKHFFDFPTEKQGTQLLNRVNILFSEKERGSKGDVTDISLCYTLYEDEGAGQMLYMPSFLVTYSDKRENAVNAISKELYNKF